MADTSDPIAAQVIAGLSAEIGNLFGLVHTLRAQLAVAEAQAQALATELEARKSVATP